MIVSEAFALDQRVNCCWSIDLNGLLFSLCTIIPQTYMSYYVKSKTEEEDSINKHKEKCNGQISVNVNT